MRQGGHGVARDERLADEHDIGTCRAVVRDIGGRENRRFGDLHRIGRDAVGQPAEQVAVELERRQIARVDADEPRAHVGGAGDLVGRVRLDERGHAELERQRVQPREDVLIERRDDQQHEVGAGCASLEHLVLGGDEVLAQDRERDRGLDGLEVGEAALEPASFGQHRDRGCTALLVEARLERGVGDLCEIAARRTRALDLGDDLHAVCGCEGGEGVDGPEPARALPPRRRRAGAPKRAPRHPQPRRP